MSFPHVSRYVFPEGTFCLGTDQFKSCLGIRSQTETSADLNPYRCRLIDLKVDVRMFEKSESKSNTTDTTANDGEFDAFWG